VNREYAKYTTRRPYFLEEIPDISGFAAAVTLAARVMMMLRIKLKACDPALARDVRR
jgi:hypothetical protein